MSSRVLLRSSSLHASRLPCPAFHNTSRAFSTSLATPSESAALPRAFPSRKSVGLPSTSPLCASFSTYSSKERKKRGLEKKVDDMVLGMGDVKDGFGHWKIKQFEQAVPSFTRAHEVLLTSLGPYNVNTIYIREQLARAHCRVFDYKKALPLLKETLHKDAFSSFNDDDVLDAHQTAFMCAVAGNMLDQAENIAMESEQYSVSHCDLALGTVALMRGEKAMPYVSPHENDDDIRVQVVSLYTTAMSHWRVCENPSDALESLKLAAKLAADPEYHGYHVLPDEADFEDENRRPNDQVEPNPDLEYSGEGGRCRCGIFLEDIWATMGEVLLQIGDEDEAGVVLRDAVRLAESYGNQEAVVRCLLATGPLFMDEEELVTGEGIYRSTTNTLHKFPPTSVRQELRAQLLKQYGELLVNWDKRQHEGNTLVSGGREVGGALPDYRFLLPRVFWARYRLDF